MTLVDFKAKYRNEITPYSFLDEAIENQDLQIVDGYKVSDKHKLMRYSPVYLHISDLPLVKLTDEESVKLFDICGPDLFYSSPAEEYVKDILFEIHGHEFYDLYMRQSISTIES